MVGVTDGSDEAPQWQRAPEEEFDAWLREMDLVELRAYRDELEAFAGDATPFGGFARVALRQTKLLVHEIEGREKVRDWWTRDWPDVPLDEVWPLMILLLFPGVIGVAVGRARRG